MVFTAFGAYIMKTFTSCGRIVDICSIAQFDVVFPYQESLSVDVGSMFDIFIGHLRLGDEYHKGEVTDILLELPS